MAENQPTRLEVIYNPGDIIFCEYEYGNEFYIIKEGKVRITKIQDNKEKTLDVLEPPSIFGEMAIIEDAPRSATAIAETQTKLIVLKKENFYSLLISNPEWALSLIKILSKRIYDATRRLKILSLPENEAKVLDTILMLVEWKGIIPAEYTDNKPIDLDGVNENSVAHWCGLPVQEVDKILTRYANLNRIVRKPDKLVVTNLPDIYRIIKNKRKMLNSQD